MNIEKAHRIFFLGIGGIGMSAMARYFNDRGKSVSGYDRNATKLTRELISEGIPVQYTDEPGNLMADYDLVVYTPAIPKSNKLMAYFRAMNIPIVKRAEVLGEITRDKFTIAVAGTHGKTTITSIIGHILYQAGHNVTALVGGICRNYNSNFISRGTDEIMVVEADEFDRSFLELTPDIAVISSMDTDHLDVYTSRAKLLESFNMFANNIKPNGKLILWHGLHIELRDDIIQIDYAVEDGGADIIADNIVRTEGKQYFSILLCEYDLHRISFNMPGRHNIANALAASAACMRTGASGMDVRLGLESYEGVERRFDILVNKPGKIYIDDYAHHPEEIRSCIVTIREMYPGKKITGVFQPHLYTRTQDLADAFAESLDLLDEALLLDIYPAREAPIEGISSELILKKMQLHNKSVISKTELLNKLKEKKPEVLVTMGAGDIDQLTGPIQKIMNGF